MSHPPDRCWVITDAAAGNERQALALAQALGLGARVWQIEPRPPWSWFSPRLTLAARSALPAALRDEFGAPWPEVAIGCGRAAALFTRVLRPWSDGATCTVQILDPRIDARHFDLVVAPRHDGLDGPNVIRTLGALNPVDDAWLESGAAAFPELALLPQPRTAVLVGASHRSVAVDLAYCIELLERLAARWRDTGGSFLVSTSRRTPAALSDWLRSAFAKFPGRYWSGSADGPNPYPGYLAHADRIVVTPDSVNMLSEACATGRPVYAWLPRPAKGKLRQFHEALVASGHLRLIGQPAAVAAPPAPLRETAAVAAALRVNLLARRRHPGG